VRSCVNLVELLQDDCEIAVVTSDRDLGERSSFKSVPLDQWTIWEEKARVFYATSRYGKFTAFRNAITEFAPDTVYLNGMFSSGFSVAPIMLQRRWRSTERVVLAPRGMLKPSALRHRSWKKKPLLKLLRYSQLTKEVVFHATTPAEATEIRHEFGELAAVTCTPNVPCIPIASPAETHKVAGHCRLCFVGRIHPIKNLLLLLNQLHSVNGQCTLEVIGPVEDRAYFDACKSACTELPAGIRVNFLGPRTPDEVRQILGDCDASVSPTEGENFGHAIFESFAAGVPALISDQTMWQGLASHKAGWDLPLSQPDQFGQAIDSLCQMTSAELSLWREGALRFAHRFLSQHDLRQAYNNLLFAGRGTESVITTFESDLDGNRQRTVTGS
jgi:glycosyltransferase involved in cell wall biosynthesis